jgi:hypothetical protein
MRPHILITILAVGACQSAKSAAPPAEQPIIQLTPAQYNFEHGVRTVTNHGVEMYVAPVELAKAWQVLPAVFASFRIPVTTLDEAGRSAGNLSLRSRGQLGTLRPSKVLDCGSSTTTHADTYTLNVSVLTQLRPSPESGTLVYTQVEATARNEGTGANRVRCSSTGYLERAIAEGVAKAASK